MLSRAQKPTAVATLTATADPSVPTKSMQDNVADGKGAVYVVYMYPMYMHVNSLTSKQGNAKQLT